MPFKLLIFKYFPFYLQFEKYSIVPMPEISQCLAAAAGPYLASKQKCCILNSSRQWQRFTQQILTYVLPPAFGSAFK